MLEEFLREGLTFDDVTLLPAESTVLPGDADLRTQLAPTVQLHVPVMSSAMDTVTEAPMAIAIARLGGLAVIHRNLDPAAQAAAVRAVKAADAPFGANPNASRDASGRLLVAAALGVGPDRDPRVEALVAAGCDVLCFDTAHGHSSRVVEAVRAIRKRHPQVAVFAGNVSTADGCAALCDAGAHAIKVGQGPGSICTTRIVAGIGVPQVTAIADCARVAEPYQAAIIGDGGVRYSGDIVKAIAAGAHAVMLGSLLAGTLESPGEVFEDGGRAYKGYRGMGSLGAMHSGAGSSERYGQDPKAQKFVPEGVEGRVTFKGPVFDVVFQLMGGLRAGMGYLGCGTIAQVRARARFMRVSSAGLRESHAHDITITAQAPNYGRG